MNRTYQVVIKGVKDGFTDEQVITNLSHIFKSTEDQIRPVLLATNFVVKKSVDIQAAEKYRNVLEQNGCICVVVPEVKLPPSNNESQLANSNNKFCQNCGTKQLESAKFCASCGTPITVIAPEQVSRKMPTAEPAQQNSPPPPPPPHQTNETPVPNSLPTAAQVQIEEPWKTKFSLIEKAGGYKLPHIRDLTYGEKKKVLFNVWGFLFGQIYYLVKGMWKKAIVLFILCSITIVFIDYVLATLHIYRMPTWIISSVVCATRANIDYYKKMILNDNGWW